MHLDVVRSALERQLRSAPTHHAFLDGRARRPALAGFGGPEEAIAFLHTRGPEGCQRRSEVTAAMIAEAQRRETCAWSAMLLLAYFPGLLSLRAGMRSSARIGAGEFSALLIESFLETARALPLATQGKLAVVNLVLGTRKAAWRHLARETARAEREEPLSDKIDELPGDQHPSPERVALDLGAERAMQPDRVRAWALDPLEDEAADDPLLVLSTHASGAPLIDWVRDQNPHLGGRELAREYGRLRRRRSRLVERTRGRLAGPPVSHGAPRAALFDSDLRLQA